MARTEVSFAFCAWKHRLAHRYVDYDWNEDLRPLENSALRHPITSVTRKHHVVICNGDIAIKLFVDYRADPKLEIKFCNNEGMHLKTFYFDNPIDDNNQYTSKLAIVNYLSYHMDIEFDAVSTQNKVMVNIQKRIDDTDDPCDDHIFSRTYQPPNITYNPS